MAKKILIAEDEKAIAEALKLKLEHAGYNVTLTRDGREALSAIEAGGFDLVILDLVMPKVDGFQFLEAVKKKKINIPIVVTSNLSQGEDEQRARDLGAKDYFTKSDVTLAEVVERIKSILS